MMEMPGTIRSRNQPQRDTTGLGDRLDVGALSVKVGWLPEHHSWEADLSVLIRPDLRFNPVPGELASPPWTTFELSPS